MQKALDAQKSLEGDEVTELATECGGKANDKSYECGYVWRNGSTNDGYKEVKASLVGCRACDGNLGRTRAADVAVTNGNGGYAGGFSIGNPSL